MYREILFRGKRVDNGKWIYGSLTTNRLKDYTFIEVLNKKGHSLHTVIHETIGQYTGLTDKNGVRIFEGDILDLTYYMIADVGVVKFGEYKDLDMSNDYPCGHVGFYVDVENQRISVRKDILFFVAECKVTCNIHDDPELLGGETNA